MQKKVTQTINRLHFSDLDPLRFEDLCLNLISRLEKWSELNHFGRKGSDEGVDIFATLKISCKEKTWFIQCKRYLKLAKKDLKEIVDKALKNKTKPDKLLVIVSCDLSKASYDFFKKYCKENGIDDSEIWTSSVLEAKLYQDYSDLLFVYFGIQIANKTKSNITRIKHSLRMEKRILKDLTDNAFIKKTNNYRVFLYQPEAKFITQRVIIHSVDDYTYPNIEDTSPRQMSPWFRTHFYDTYHNGIELWLAAAMGAEVIMDKNGYWEPLTNYDDKRKNNSNYKVIRAKQIGRIAYYNIIDYKLSDEYYSEPHLYCKFDIDNMPYEKIYYKSYSDPKKEIADWEFDENKRTVFSNN